MNIGASHFPVVCTCSACVPAGAAVKSTLISTPLVVSRSAAVPIVFPIASLIVAEAVPAGVWANSATLARTTELQNAKIFIREAYQNASGG